MRVIVVGCGKVGTSIASQLSQEGCNVTVIDKNPLHVVRVSDTCDVLGIEGDGSSYKTLEEAGVQEADLVIAVTDSDEKNLLCCLIAKKGGHAATIARVRNPAYSREAAFFRENFDLAMAVNPEMAVAAEIARVVRFPSAISIEIFAKGHVELLTFRLASDSILIGKTLYYIHSHLHCDVLVLLVRRGTQVTVPSGSFVLEGGDIAQGENDRQDHRAGSGAVRRARGISARQRGYYSRGRDGRGAAHGGGHRECRRLRCPDRP